MGRFQVLKFLVHLGCYNKLQQTGQFINNRNLFLIVLEAGNPKIKAPAWFHTGEGSLRGSQLGTFLLQFSFIRY